MEIEIVILLKNGYFDKLIFDFVLVMLRFKRFFV